MVDVGDTVIYRGQPATVVQVVTPLEVWIALPDGSIVVWSDGSRLDDDFGGRHHGDLLRNSPYPVKNEGRYKYAHQQQIVRDREPFLVSIS